MEPVGFGYQGNAVGMDEAVCDRVYPVGVHRTFLFKTVTVKICMQ